MAVRIAQLANFVGATSGGMRVAIENLGRGYQAAGANRLLVIPGSYDRILKTADRGYIAQIASPKVNSVYRMIVNMRAVYRLLERFEPTSLEINDKWTLPHVAGWGRRRGIPSVLFSHERLDDMAANWVGRSGAAVRLAIGRLNAHLARSFDRIVVTTRYSAAEWPDSAPVQIVALGVDSQTFAFQPREPGAPIRLCYAGRISHEKHPQLAVETVKYLVDHGYDVSLDVYGTGPDLRRLRALAYGYPIYFCGHVPKPAVLAGHYASHDISLSVSPTETFGLAVLEALACGTPVVTSNRGGAYELVDPSCSQSGDPHPQSLAEATARLIDRLGPGIRKAARDRAVSFSWQRSVDEMMAIHRDLA